jgi:vacuolar protein sorting-associated protein 13A/C
VRADMDAEAAVSVDAVFQSAQANKLYFESLVIHPIKLKLSFAPSTCPRSQRTLNRIPAYRSLRRIQNVGTVEDFEIKINSFIVNNAMESLGSLQSRILAKIKRDMQAHLVQIAGNLFGSLSLLGKPAGLYKNIGSGVQDFFYEVGFDFFHLDSELFPFFFF